jgi:hypothetical protein
MMMKGVPGQGRDRTRQVTSEWYVAMGLSYIADCNAMDGGGTEGYLGESQHSLVELSEKPKERDWDRTPRSLRLLTAKRVQKLVGSGRR